MAFAQHAHTFAVESDLDQASRVTGASCFVDDVKGRCDVSRIGAKHKRAKHIHVILLAGDLYGASPGQHRVRFVREIVEANDAVWLGKLHGDAASDPGNIRAGDVVPVEASPDPNPCRDLQIGAAVELLEPMSVLAGDIARKMTDQVPRVDPDPTASESYGFSGSRTIAARASVISMPYSGTARWP